MNTVEYIALAFIAYIIIKALFFTPRTPIPETSSSITKITTPAHLHTLLASTQYVIVDFYADWCPPCRAIAPIFSTLADTYAVNSKLAFAKVNVDHVKDVASEFGVSAMPTFVFFRDGLPQGVHVDGLSGARGSVVRTEEGLVARVRGADKVALEAVVKALAREVGGGGGGVVVVGEKN
ncbi:thioredoxin-like protein [Xylaria sp. FL0064]|nr:thioredoxin-like protein [Xylaria sp. FL0064]